MRSEVVELRMFWMLARLLLRITRGLTDGIEPAGSEGT